MRILFTSTPGLGHVHPLLPLMRAARAAGDEVLLCVGRTGMPVAREHGFAAVAMDEPAPADLATAWARVPRNEADTYVISEIFGRLRTRAAVVGTIAQVERFRPHLVISECFEPSGGLAAEATGVPHVTVGVAPLDRRDLELDRLAAALDQVRAGVGLPPAGVPPWQHRTRFVTAVPPLLWNDFGNAPAGTLLFCHEDAEGPPARPQPRAPGARPRVYATLGSAVGGLRVGERAFPALLAGLGGAPADVLLSTVAYDPDRFTALPGNVQVRRHVAFGEAMACEAVVHHGGCGTTVAVLSRGLPSVTMPLVSDGPHTAARLAALGVGVTVALEKAPLDLPAALRRVLREPSFSRNAGLVAADMARYPSAAQVLARIRAATVDSRPRAGVHRGVSDSPSGHEAGGEA